MQRDDSKTVLSGAAVLLAIAAASLLLGGLVWMIGEQQRSERRWFGRLQCMNMTKQVAIGIVIYVADNNDCMPLAANWYDRVHADYLDDRDYSCPLGKTLPGYNGNLNAVNSARIDNPSDVPMVFDTSATGSNPVALSNAGLALRHGGYPGLTAHVARADSSTVSYDSTKASSLSWIPKMMPPPKPIKKPPTKKGSARH